MSDAAEVFHFTYGFVTLVLSYGFSVLGSLLALVCTARAQAIRERPRRAWWLLLAAWALGGTGIWVMHFTAMLGFTVPDSPVRYDVPLTVVSWVAAIIVVGVGLLVAGFGRPSAAKVVLGGLIAGSGVAIMHYFGMAAMHVNGDVGHDRRFVAAAGAIAIAASTVALWFTVTLRRVFAIVLGAFIMGVAVNGMHYTGMAGVRVHLHAAANQVPGVPALTFLGPMMIFVLLVVVTLAYAMLRSTDVDAGWIYQSGAPAGTEPAAAGAPWDLSQRRASAPRIPAQREWSSGSERAGGPERVGAQPRTLAQQWAPLPQRRPGEARPGTPRPEWDQVGNPTGISTSGGKR
jgi:NO-binding membrane sensor protein with MHYT domain